VTAAKVGLLLGLFGPPLLLLAVGHAYRHRSSKARAAFWGGVVGYGVGVVLTTLALMLPSVAWAEGSLLRSGAVHWSLLAGGVAGAAVGWALGARGTAPTDSVR